MAWRAVVRVGDTTTHGGYVTETLSGNIEIFGKAVTGIGCIGYCPKCEKEFQIIQGSHRFYFMGREVTLEGMYTSCGAQLIASQNMVVVDDSEGSKVEQASFQPNVNKTKQKEIVELYWSYGKEHIKLADVSRFYTDLNLHIVTKGYQVGESVEANIEYDTEDGVQEFLVSGIVGKDGIAVFEYVFGNVENILIYKET